MDVLAHIKDRAEKSDKLRARSDRAAARRLAEHNGQLKQGNSILRKKAIRRGSK